MEVLTRGPKVIGWQTTAGDPIPTPVVSDDRAMFPSEVVREVLEWLTATCDIAPDPITISFKNISLLAGMKAGRMDQIKYMIESSWRKQFNPLDPLAGLPRILTDTIACEVSSGKRHQIGSCTFRRSSLTLTMQEPIVFHFRYLVAVDKDKRVIVGPMIGKTQTARLEVA